MSKMTVDKSIETIVDRYNKMSDKKILELFGMLEDYISHLKKSPRYNSNTRKIIDETESLIGNINNFKKVIPNLNIGEIKETDVNPVYILTLNKGYRLFSNINRKDIINEKYISNKEESLPQIFNYIMTRLLFSDMSIFNLANRVGIKILTIVISNLFMNIIGRNETELYDKNGYGLVIAMVMSALNGNINRDPDFVHALESMNIKYNNKMVKEYEDELKEASSVKSKKIGIDDIFNTLKRFGYIENMDMDDFVIKTIKILGVPGLMCLDIKDLYNPAYIATSLTITNKKAFGSLYNYVGELKTVSKYDLIEDIYEYWLIFMKNAI